MGIVMKDYQLGEPIVLSGEGTFVAPASGRLHLRCNDSWTQLTDNSGELHVELTVSRKHRDGLLRTSAKIPTSNLLTTPRIHRGSTN